MPYLLLLPAKTPQFKRPREIRQFDLYTGNVNRAAGIIHVQDITHRAFPGAVVVFRDAVRSTSMQMISAEEKAAMERKLEELYKAQVDVQDRIRKAASLGDLSENAEYHFAKEENRSIQRELAELQSKLKNAAVVSNEGVPEDMVYLGHTVRLLDLDDDSEQLVRLVGEAQAPSAADSDVLSVSVSSPMGEAMLKARIGDTIKVKAPRGTMEFKILEIV
jgi:transcription elongation factor GreA